MEVLTGHCFWFVGDSQAGEDELLLDFDCRGLCKVFEARAGVEVDLLIPTFLKKQ